MPAQNSGTNLDKPSEPSNVRTGLYTGLIAGSAQAAVFHAPDRALYLAQTAKPHPRFFFDPLNWQHPFHNIGQSVLQRTMTSGSYFAFQTMFSPIKTYCLTQGYSKETANVALGITAGSITGALNNPFTYTRYVSWGPDNLTFTQSARNLYQAGGFGIFTRGITPSIMRDAIFGSIYEVTRARYNVLLNADGKPFIEFSANMMGATTAIVFAAPFNYLRNTIYKTPPTEPSPSVYGVTKQLFFSAKAHNATVSELGSYLGRALQIGPATVRFACGMAFGQFVSDKVKSAMQDDHAAQNKTSTPSL